MPFWAIVAGGLLAAAISSVRPTAASDVETCNHITTNDVVIAACSRAIASGHYTDGGLANLYMSRAIAGWHASSRAVQDFDAAIALDPRHAHTETSDPVDVGEGQFVVCCRAVVYDCRSKIAYRFKDSVGPNTNRCLETCTNAARCQ